VTPPANAARYYLRHEPSSAMDSMSRRRGSIDAQRYRCRRPNRTPLSPRVKPLRKGEITWNWSGRPLELHKVVTMCHSAPIQDSLISLSAADPDPVRAENPIRVLPLSIMLLHRSGAAEQSLEETQAFNVQGPACRGGDAPKESRPTPIRSAARRTSSVTSCWTRFRSSPRRCLRKLSACTCHSPRSALAAI
jgi:hypothetical protein